MPIDRELLEILVCPACKGTLRLLEQQSGLACAGCERVFPIRDGIPVLIVDEAVPPEEKAGKR